MKTVYYFGNKYYAKSGSHMGLLYTEKGERYDWGRLEIDSENGIEILVKPATAEMIAWAEKTLAEKYGVAV